MYRMALILIICAVFCKKTCESFSVFIKRGVPGKNVFEMLEDACLVTEEPGF
jgi:hypothetical protein